MKRSHGTRQGTRSILSKSKSQRSRLNISKVMHSYSDGDKVSIVIDGAQQRECHIADSKVPLAR